MSLLKRIGGTSAINEQGAPTQGRAGGGQVEVNRFASAPREQEDNAFTDIRSRVQNKLISELDPKLNLSDAAKVRQQVEDIFNTILDGKITFGNFFINNF